MLAFQVSIRGLAGVVLVTALVLASLMYPSTGLASLIYSLTMATFTIAFVIAIRVAEPRRSSRLAFATAGWCLMIAFGLGAENGGLKPGMPPLITTMLIEMTYANSYFEHGFWSHFIHKFTPVNPGDVALTVPCKQAIGHCFLALLAAVMAGRFAVRRVPSRM